MARRHWLLLLAVAGLVATGAGGTGAFASATAERDFSVSVASPEDAYLGVSEPLVSTVPEEGARADLLTVTNRFDESVDLTVSVAETDPDGGPSVADPVVTTPLAPGEEGVVTADLSCESAGTESVTVSLSATGTSVRVVGISRTFDLTCSTDDQGEDGDGDEDGQGEDEG